MTIVTVKVSDEYLEGLRDLCLMALSSMVEKQRNEGGNQEKEEE